MTFILKKLKTYFIFTIIDEKQITMKNLIFLLFSLCLLASCSNMGNSNARAVREAANKARTQQFYDQVFNGHNLNLIDSFCVADFVDHNPEVGHDGKGTHDLKAQLTDFFKTFPDIHVTTNFMVAQGDTVVAHITLTGTNIGAMGDMPATNKKISVSGIDIIAIKGRKAVERWGFFDNQKMMADLGMGMGAPPPAAEAAKPMEPAKPAAKPADKAKPMEKKK